MTQQQVIVITGASDGIGAAAARQLSARGEKVILVGRSPDKRVRPEVLANLMLCWWHSSPVRASTGAM